MDLAEASHAIPPVGEGKECQVCGYLAQNTTGVLSHLRSTHPQAATEPRAVEERAVEERAVEEREVEERAVEERAVEERVSVST